MPDAQMPDTIELCSGCGAIAPKHPYAGVMRDRETGLFAEFPVCLLCWRDPEHRQAPLKMHFFDRAMAPQAVKDAEDNILCDPPPQPQ